MINKDNELADCVKSGEICDFLKGGNTDIAEISASRIRELLLDLHINSVRIKGAVISGALDLRDTLSAEGSPIGGLELINCMILQPLRLERSHLTHLSLLKSAFTELHAQNCRIEGHVDLGYVYSSEEPESRSFKDNPKLISDNHAIDEVFKNISKLPDKTGKTGLSGPDNWWKYETALEIKSDSKKDPSGRCQVNLSEASIGGSLYLDGCRLVAAAIGTSDHDKDGAIEDAINLSLASIGGDCFVRGGHRQGDSVSFAKSGSFLGKFNGKNISLLGDFWGCGGIYWGDSSRAVFFQGARIKGGVFFQEIETDQSNETKPKHSKVKAVIRGELNFLAARIEGWSDLRGLHCVQLNFSTATIGSNFQLKIEDKSETKSLQIIDLRSMKVGGDFSISIKNYNENSTVNRSQLIMDSSEVKGEFKLEGDIDSTVFAENMRVDGSCLIAAHFRNHLKFPSLKVGGDFKFDSTIYKAVSIQDKSNAENAQVFQDKSNIDAQAQVILDGTEVSGDFRFTGTIEGTVSAKNMRINGFCSIEDSAIFKEKVEFIALNTEGDVRFYPTIHKQADLSGIHVRGSLYLSSDLEKRSDYFKSLTLVKKITSEDWRNFADSQSDSKNFLYECLNRSPCGLILKHAVIEKELRIHQLQTELGDIYTSRINWTGRLCEFLRRPLRLLISVCEKYLPDTFSDHLVKWAKIGLKRLYDISVKRTEISPKQIEVTYFSNELSFYPGFYWIRCYVEQKANGHVASGGLIDCLCNPAEEEIVILGGKSIPIHQLNQKGKLKLETDQVKDYLRFFCECVWGDKGPFHIYEVPHASDKPKIKKERDEIKITKEEPDYWVAQAHIIYADYVFEATFHIHKNGLIEMVEDGPLQGGVELRFQFAGPYRYDNSGKEKTLEAVRPMRLELHSNKEAINDTSLALEKLKKRVSDDIDKFPDPPKINEQSSFLIRIYEKMFYSYTGEYRRRLDRVGLFLPMQLPVIDLRGAHVETLNDRRGNGWRHPESPKQPHPDTWTRILLSALAVRRYPESPKLPNLSWLNFEIFLRLEGFSYNRLIHILERKQILEKEQIDKTISSEFKNSATAVPPSLDDQNDQNWRSRLEWLYRQYPQSTPNGVTFHQQPFSQIIKAYRSRGEIANVNGILRSKISIEFMLFAQRVTPVFLLIFSLLAGIVFIIATLMTPSVNDNLLPVVWGMGAGVIGAFCFGPKQEKVNRNIFFRAFFISLVITYVVFGYLFTEQSLSASVFFTQMLFLSIVIWGILGGLFIYFFKNIYRLCFGYGLSFFRALLTILVCLTIGTWGVNKANDGKLLVLNVEYATLLVDGEDQPRFVHITVPEGTPSLQPVELDQTKSADEMKCEKAIDPFIYAMDVFISLVDLRQEFLCNAVPGRLRNMLNGVHCLNKQHGRNVVNIS